MKWGENIAKLRGGGSYAELARIASCGTPTIRDMESGSTADPGINLVARITRHFGVSLDWLADESQTWPPPANTSKDRIIEVEERCLRPLAGIEDFYPEEQPVIARLRDMHWTDRPPVMAVLSAVMDLHDEAVKLGAGPAPPRPGRTRGRERR